MTVITHLMTVTTHLMTVITYRSWGDKRMSRRIKLEIVPRGNSAGAMELDLAAWRAQSTAVL
jgi:hypothetical protein